jgi:hypothetical protein
VKLIVFVHDPLESTGWQEVEKAATPDEAAALARSWGARGWRVLCVSTECRLWDSIDPPVTGLSHNMRSA